MGKKIIFIDSSKTAKIRYMTGYNYTDETFYVDWWDTGKIFIDDKTRIRYPINDTVIFLSDGDRDFNDVYVRSIKYKAPMNLRVKAQQGSPDGLLYAYISTAFKIFDDVNAKCKSEGKNPVWMLIFDLDDGDMSAVLRNALDKVFDAFSCRGPRSDMMISELYGNYHPEVLYNMMAKNLINRDHKDNIDALVNATHLICSRGNGKTAFVQKQLYRMMLNSTYGIKGGLNMDSKLYNFRKNIKEIKRDKKNPGKFLLETKDGFLSREIVCDGFSKEELYSEEFIETILVIATQIQYDGITKVIFNKEEKLTIIFPHNSYNFSERIIVKATGLDGFDLLCGYSIAKAKMLCSGDGYQWYNKLRKSGKVDV